MTFKELNIIDPILKAIELQGYTHPTPIQEQSIPILLRGKDLLGCAQTGTGKTAAFAIPILQHLYNNRQRNKGSRKIKALIVTPTRELAIQIGNSFTTYGKYTGLRNTVVFGGVKQGSQTNELSKGVDILVATPGRLLDLIQQGIISLQHVEFSVLDEADHMLDLGFIKDIRDLMRHLPKQRQTLFFSATIDQEIKKLAYSLVINPIRIQISPKDPVAKNVNHAVAFIEMDDKRFFLEKLIKNNIESKFVVFTRTKVRAERVLKAMERVDIDALSIHGDKDQKDRFDVMTKIKAGKVKVLIATDVSARGIDIPNVDYVINYDLPEQAENYVHRVGRTGRGRNKGLAYSFCSPQEKELLEDIEDLIGKKVSVLDINKADYESVKISSDETHSDWKTLMKEIDDSDKKYKSRKKKKKK